MGQNDTTIVRPDFDEATHISATKLAPKVIKYAMDRMYAVHDLYKEKANKTDLNVNLLTYNPLIVWAFSHGSEDAVWASDTETLIDLTNAHWFKDRIVMLEACLCGKKLAPAMVSAGARAVFAYTGALSIGVWPPTGEPLEGFVETQTMPKIMYDGLTAKEAYDKTIEEYNRWIECWDVKNPLMADLLRGNRDAFTLFGDGTAKVTLSAYATSRLANTLSTSLTMVWMVIFTTLQIIKSIKLLIEKGS